MLKAKEQFQQSARRAERPGEKPGCFISYTQNHLSQLVLLIIRRPFKVHTYAHTDTRTHTLEQSFNTRSDVFCLFVLI